jgi:hypothetical protein
MKKSFPSCMLAMTLLVGAAGCNSGPPDAGDAGDAGDEGDSADVPAGSTVLVAILNPVVNSPHTTGVPGEQGTVRDGIDVDPEPGGADVSVDGLAVVEVPVGSIDVRVGPAALGLDVDIAGDVYDAPIAFDGDRAAYFANTPIRYPVGEGGGAIFFDPDIALSEINATLTEDNVIVVLRPGIYAGDLVIKGRDVLVFGEGWSEFAVVIDGSVSVEGNGDRVRGVTITGDLASKGNGFGISFSRVLGTTSITSNGGAFVRNVFCGPAVVPSTDATLLDNYGIAPIETPLPGTCDL